MVEEAEADPLAAAEAVVTAVVAAVGFTAWGAEGDPMYPEVKALRLWSARTQVMASSTFTSKLDQACGAHVV